MLWKAGRPYAVAGQEFAPKVSWQDAVAAGNDIKQTLAGIDAQQVREVLAGLTGGTTVNLGDALQPLTQLAPVEFSPQTVETIGKIAGKKQSEVPYITDWLQAIADWDTGKPFSTAIELEVDGITHGMSSNAMALGIAPMALRAGVINPHPDLKLTPANDLEITVTEQDVNHFIEREKQRGGRPTDGPEGTSAELVEYRLAQEGKALPPNEDGSFSWTDYRDLDGTRVDIKMLDPGKNSVWFRDTVQRAKAEGTHDVDQYEFWERVVWPKDASGKNRALKAGDKVVVRPLGRIAVDKAFELSEPVRRGTGELALDTVRENLSPSPHSEVAGDVRDKMKSVMQQTAREMAKTIIADADAKGIDALVELAGEAIQDRDNYLKKSPMTLGYGQEIGSLKMHVKTTINSGDRFREINQIIDNPDNDVELGQAVEYLHTLLVNSIFESLDSRVLQVADQLRANNVLATLTDRPIVYTNASGFESSVTKEWDLPDSVQYTTFKEAGGRDVSVPVYTEKYAAGSTPRQYQEGGEAIPGGFGHGRIVPTVAQTYDAAMMSGIVTGQAGKRLEEQVKGRGYEYSFLPVFDAAKVDLAHLDVVRDAMNREWWEGIKKVDYVGELMGPGGWYDQTLRDFRKQMDELPSDLRIEISPDNEWRGMYYFINDFKHVKKIFDKYHPSGIIRDEKGNERRDPDYDGYNDTVSFFSNLRTVGIKKYKTDPDITTLTPVQMKAIVDEMMEQLKVKQRNTKIAGEVKRDREELFKKVRAQDILQVDL